MKNRPGSPKRNINFIFPSYYQKHLNSFMRNLSSNGYTEFTIDCYRGPVKHFGIWLHRKSIPLIKVNDKVILLFAKHHCRCSGKARESKLSYKYIIRIRKFILYLIKKKFISVRNDLSEIQLPSLLVKFKKSLQDRGLSSITIMHYERSIVELLPLLGDNPRKYSSEIIRRVIYRVAKKFSLPATKKLTTALRSYLRFLAMEKKCHLDLDSTVPTVAQWKLSSLPKYITTKEVERVIASCDVNTKLGLRDRAIILFLARLGLRAGDIINMLIDDINWKESTVRVRGKGRREAVLPLTQEVGDALLAYIKQSRPQVAIDQVFLCINAPHRPFPFSSDISSIVSAAISRAKIIDPPSRGASLLRHSAATTMLRNGATLETVSAVLRHRSLDMTSYYAKVDIRMLTKIAQPWPEGAPNVN